jgi:hypothetical protein
VIALTVAQPFGIVAKRQAAPPPRTAKDVGSTGVHVVRAFGFVPLPFALYTRSRVYVDENMPTATLRARSWAWAPFLTNATHVTDVCGNSVETPCWQYGDSDAGQLGVYRSGGSTWVSISNPYLNEQNARSVPAQFTWKLGFGVASIAGLVYWAVAGLLLVLARVRLRRMAVG